MTVDKNEDRIYILLKNGHVKTLVLTEDIGLKVESKDMQEVEGVKVDGSIQYNQKRRVLQCTVSKDNCVDIVVTDSVEVVEMPEVKILSKLF